MIRFATICLAGFALAGVRAEEPSPEYMARKFLAAWLVVEKTEAGVSTKDPERLGGHEYSEKFRRSWGRRGELVAHTDLPPRIDAAKIPMRVDFPAEDMPGAGRPKTRSVLPSIFKFDGDNLVIAYGTQWSDDVPPKEGGDFPGRPSDFTSTKENKVTVEISKSCGYLAQD